MGTGVREPKTYLAITYGKLRKSSNAEDKIAVSRENKDGKVVYEQVYDWIDGRITKIFHKEDREFGNSFEIMIDDGQEKFNVSLKEDSRYCTDFLSKLPNIKLNEIVKLVPYDFKPKDSDNNKKGLTIWQNDAKVENYFVKKEEDKWTYSHDFPPSDGKMDEDDFKAYMIKVKKFLRIYTKENIIPKFEFARLEDVADKIRNPIDDFAHDEESSDVPF